MTSLATPTVISSKFYLVYIVIIDLPFLQDEEGWEYLEEDQALHNFNLPVEVSLICIIVNTKTNPQTIR